MRTTRVFRHADVRKPPRRRGALPRELREGSAFRQPCGQAGARYNP